MKNIFFAGLLLAVCFSRLFAQPALFEHNDALEVELRADLIALQRDRGKDPHYHDAWLSVKMGKQSREIACKIKPRGNFRLDSTHCIFPPLWLKFGKYSATPSTPFEGLERVKMVTHCDDDQYVLKEYLVYRVHNIVSPYSFRVRLARITYKDIQNRIEAETHYSFFLEPVEMLGERLNLSVYEGKQVSLDDAPGAYLSQLACFSYLVGNRDWDVTLRKNLVILADTVKGEVYPVPYDFDFCGAVQPPYVINILLSGDKTYAWRRFSSMCLKEHELKTVLEDLQRKQVQIYELYKKCPQLKSNHRRDALRFYDEYYSRQHTPRSLREESGWDCPEE